MIRAFVRYSLGLVAIGTIGAVVAVRLVSAGSDDRVEARALVVAQDLRIGVDELRASVDAVYRYGAVAEAAVAAHDLPVTAKVLKRHVDVVVVASTPVIQVVGRDVDPAMSIAYANAVAEELATVLNEVKGIGTFAVVAEATTSTVEKPAGPPIMLLAVLAGLTSAGAVYVLLLNWVRPMFTMQELAEMSTSPFVVGTDLRDPDIGELADSLANIGVRWLLVDANSYQCDQLSSGLLKAAPQLEFRVARLNRAAIMLRNHPDTMVAVVVAAGVRQSVVRHAEAMVGDRLAATIMIDER
jgi:hypothetical protein